jgi:hypothetical protein
VSGVAGTHRLQAHLQDLQFAIQEEDPAPGQRMSR